MRGIQSFSCLSEPATHPQTAEVAVQSLQPAPHPTIPPPVPGKEVLEGCTQVPLAAWQSSLCLEQGINLSPEGW